MADKDISLKIGNVGWVERIKRLSPVVICLFIPALLLIGAYIHMSLFYKRVWLFDTIVHENGKYTLLQVVFYFRHFTWEALIKAVYAFFIVGAFYYYGRPKVRTDKASLSVIPMRRVFFSALFAFSLILISVLITANQIGLKEAVHGLLQYKTADARPPEFGSHWRNHFLSNIVLFSASALLIILYRMVYCGGWIHRRFSNLFPVSLGLFVFFTYSFGLTVDPFETPSYLGHQLREIFGTDLSITMLLSMSVLIYLEGKYDSAGADGRGEGQRANKNILNLVPWSLPVVFITGFLVIKVLTLDVSGAMANLGGTEGWSVLDLFAWHFFEHSLDYILVVSLIYVFYLLTLRLEDGRD